MVERDADVHTEVIDNLKADTMQAAITDVVEAGSTVHTDECRSYNGLEKHGYEHMRVNHGAGEYVSGDSHVNTIEGFWCQLKKGISGTHVFASKKHLPKYAKEFEYRYNSRHQPEAMFNELVSSYQPVSSEEE